MPNDRISNRRRLLRLVALIEGESPSDGVDDTDAGDLFKCGGALRDRLAEVSGDVEQASDEEVRLVVLEDVELSVSIEGDMVPRRSRSRRPQSGRTRHR